MIEFLSANLGTIVVAALLAAVLIAIVFKIKKDRKKGKGCGCDCSCCPSAGMCHPNVPKEK